MQDEYRFQIRRIYVISFKRYYFSFHKKIYVDVHTCYSLAAAECDSCYLNSVLLGLSFRFVT